MRKVLEEFYYGNITPNQKSFTRNSPYAKAMDKLSKSDAYLQEILNEDGKVFIQGRVSAEDDKASKLILEKIRSFDDVPRELWIQFDSRSDYSEKETQLLRDLQLSPGNSGVVIYLKDVKAMKKLPMNWQVQIQEPWLSQMSKKYGKTNVKVVERGLKKF